MDLKISTREFVRWLITKLGSKFGNSQWRIQYGGRKCKKLLDLDDTWYSGHFGVGDYESELRIQKCKMTDPIWRTKMQKLFDWDNIRYSEVFGVADYESELKILKSKIADATWWTKMKKGTS